MENDVRDHVSFYLTGRRSGPEVGQIDGVGLRPAMMARFRDLTELRHDFPLVLARGTTVEPTVVSLSGLIDDILAEVAQGADADRLRHHAMRLECEMRKAVGSGARITLSTLWDQAGRSLADGRDSLFADSLARLRKSLRVDGDVVGCDRDLPMAFVAHSWKIAHENKRRRMRDLIERMIIKLSDILRADDANSAAAVSPDRLEASIGKGFANEFDFAELSRLLATARPAVALSKSRRARIERLLSALESQAFFPSPAASRERTDFQRAAYTFQFRSCTEALDAYRERLPHMIELAKVIAAAELEIDGRYREDVHDAMFESLGAGELGPPELSQFPDYLVHVDADTMTAVETASLTEILSAGLPMRILVQIDDLGAPPTGTNGHASAAARARQIAHAAIGIGGVYILQATNSHVYRLRNKIFQGLAFEGPVLLSIYSGAAGSTGDLPPYLVSAAALESRAFPAFTYDPSAGTDWASRFSLDANPQADRDWPVHNLGYEAESLQRAWTEAAFTLADFLACDGRYARYFARVPNQQWNGSMIPVPDCVTNDGASDRVPYVLMVDKDNVLHRVIVDSRMIRETRRCRERWRTLQELGGINNSHAQRLLAREREAWEERARREGELRAAVEAPAADTSAASVMAPETACPAPTQPEMKRSDDPYVETPRCSSCNECIKINDRMFKYDRNKQAYIADPEAGTYAQLVQAAESCQVAIIHPGKPRNPNEPGLEELLKRVEPFI